MPQTLITVSTDGFRDYVDLPDGRQVNLGSISVLKLVTSLVRKSSACRVILDTFLEKGSASLAVSLGELEDMLRPKRARWAGYEDPFITDGLYQQCFRGISMNSTKIRQHLDTIERHLVTAYQCANPSHRSSEKTASLSRLVGSLASEVAGPRVASLGKTSAVDDVAKNELELYMENESSIYNQKKSIIANIIRKMKAGTYDPDRAPALWAYWVEAGAKAYVKEFGGTIQETFPKDLRKKLAEELAKDYEKAIKDGEYGDVTPTEKKAPKKAPKKSSDLWKEKSAADELEEQEDSEGQEKEASDESEGQEDSEGQEKEASDLTTEETNEAFAHLAMARVESALRVVEASEKKGTSTAKGDLNKISMKLESLIRSSDLGDPQLRVELKKLAGLAEKVHTYFSI